MSELLAKPVVRAGARTLGAPEPALDSYTRARMAEAAESAYERGRRDGAADAAAVATAAADRIAGALERAAATVTAELRALRGAQADADVELALAIAESVLGREPHDGGAALTSRVRATLARLDDPQLTVHAHPADVDALVSALHDEPGVRVAGDGSLGPGEARISGAWARADLTRQAGLDVLREALGAQR